MSEIFNGIIKREGNITIKYRMRNGQVYASMEYNPHTEPRIPLECI